MISLKFGRGKQNVKPTREYYTSIFITISQNLSFSSTHTMSCALLFVRSILYKSVLYKSVHVATVGEKKNTSNPKTTTKVKRNGMKLRKLVVVERSLSF